MHIGSTPRMRGISPIFEKRCNYDRFNPAYAGNITCLSSYPDSVEVQPRVCGEYSSFSSISGSPIGSTPRMRGILNFVNVFYIGQRFNPAYAGNIVKCRIHQVTSQVQPRVCGEYSNKVTNTSIHLGSTPRMRGIY